MPEGEYWYLDLGKPHRVENRSNRDRVHLVVDCVLNEWLHQVIEASPEMAATPSPEGEFGRFRRLVLSEPRLQSQLRGEMDRAKFISLMLDLGGQQGARFTAGDVDAALQAARRAWTERQI
jgi:hypothetical protein